MLQTIVTAAQGDLRQSELPPLLPVQRSATAGDLLSVDTTIRFQTLEGFGGAFTEAAAVNWLGLSGAQRKSALRAYFAEPAEGGHGYSLCRVHMNSCDFALGNYAHVERAGDIELQSFSIARDREALLPLIHAAQQYSTRPLRVLMSPWSPPSWMKSNQRMNGGGHLLPQYRQAWAECFVRFIQAYREEGVDVWGVTVQNEPMAMQAWDSCLYSAEEERDFIGQHLGPTLRRAGLDHIRIIAWDHNRDLLPDRARILYGDPIVRDYLWGLGFHWYGEAMFENVRRVHEAWPEKKLLLTEACQEGGPHRDEWAVGERYGQSMIADLNNSSVGWIDWNLFLNLQGGPNHVGNYCSAPVLIDADTDQWIRQISFDYIGHFTRHIYPGARRVFCAPSFEALEATAWINLDGTLAIIAMNRSPHALDFTMRINASDYEVTLQPHSIATYTGRNQSE